MKTEELAWRIRKHTVELAHITKLAHTVCALSIADIVAVLYNDVMKIDPKDPKNENRDRFVLSEGHCSFAMAAALAEKGFFSVEDLIKKFPDGGKLTNFLYKKGVSGIDFATACLGLGFPVACGMAYAGKKDKKNYNVYSIVGDGECNEGSIWEAALFAGHHKLSNLTVVVNHNKLQGQDRLENILSSTNIAERWKSFGWHVIEVNGHDLNALRYALNFRHGEKPVCVVAHTTKGKGISFMENNVVWHYLYADGEEFDIAMKELEESRP
ncbi:transketolase [Oscillibacter sp.]|uniref:transketolase n=1 Tax=Oscillibacter sp. TaxID=1945593 RepID=UPI00289CE05D|nr:transketolase [Oscillibacter sp.]